MKIKNLTTKLAVLAILIMLAFSLPLAFSTADAQEIPPAFRWQTESVFSEQFETTGALPATPGRLNGAFLG